MKTKDCYQAVTRAIKLNENVQEDLKGKEVRTRSFYLFMMQEQLAILNNLEHQLSLMRRKNKSPKQ